ncbi:RNA polymerase sigma factor [Aquihabitans daechungensis]|uniref:RNA polymerase sigma factor n=1 Tax=Aquihabitans daechungensis TaxID=1052257 RepID=UPI003B9F89C6
MPRDSVQAMVDDFDAWYTELRPAMAPALAAWCGDASVAADALDEAFTRAFERWDRVQRNGSPEGWVWRTATNVVRRRYRRRSMEQALIERSDAPRSAPGDSIEDDLDLRAALLRLTDRQRTALVLHHIADLPHRAVADAMGVATGTVAATLHQARARLAAELTTDDAWRSPAVAATDATPTDSSTDGASS